MGLFQPSVISKCAHIRGSLRNCPNLLLNLCAKFVMIYKT